MIEIVVPRFRAVFQRSPPVRGALIEIVMLMDSENTVLSPPVRGALIEMVMIDLNPAISAPSPPVRGALIEIVPQGWRVLRGLVAPREGGVD